MPRTPLLYRALTAAATPLVPFLLRDDAARAGHRARLESPSRLEHWARERRDPSRPLAWFHASSVGEGLQARAVLAAYRTLRPDDQVIYTHYSPSAEILAAAIGADWFGYLCYDRAGDVGRMLAAASPDLVVFTKLDLWPELSVRASQRGTRVAMVAATVGPDSGRLRRPARSLAAAGYRALDQAGAVSAADAERLVALGCRADRVIVTGDPRVDAALEVLQEPAILSLEGDPVKTLVAGSTWPDDENVILNAFAAVRQSHPMARLIIAPHQPTAEHVNRLESAAHALGLPQPVRLSALTAGASPVFLLIDRVGLLARLYGAGMAAYVGGGWGNKGIHSVLEPAAAARAVVIGPHDRGSRDAQLLDAASALVRLEPLSGTSRLVAVWSEWLDDPELARTRGVAARLALDAERGAALRSAVMLRDLLTARNPTRG